MPELSIETRNTWLATEAAAVTTLHVTKLLDTVEVDPFQHEQADIEDLNGLSYGEAEAKGYPRSLLQVNALGMNLSCQLAQNTILEDMLDPAQKDRFGRLTFMGKPHEVQNEYLGTYFSFMGRLLRGYIDTLPISDRDVNLHQFADLIETSFIGDRLSDGLTTANNFWGIAPYESLTDMESKEQALEDNLGIDSLYMLTPRREGSWGVMEFRPEVLEASKQFLSGNNKDAKSQRSVGCPMRFERMTVSADPNDYNYLSTSQRDAIIAGDNYVGRLADDKLTLLRKPLEELSALFAEQVRKVSEALPV